MILNRLLSHLQSTPAASLAELARVVDASPDAVRSMLETLQRKGLVHRQVPPPGCGSRCRECGVVEPEIYRLGTAPEAGDSTDTCGSGPRQQNNPGD